MTPDKKIVDKFEKFQGLVRNFDRNIFAEEGLEILVKIESLIKSIKAREERVLNNLEIDQILNASLRDIHLRKPLNFGEYIVEGKDSINSMIQYIIDKIDKVFEVKNSLDETLNILNIEIQKVNYQIVDTQEIERQIIHGGDKFEKKELECNKISLFLKYLRVREIYSDDILGIVGENNKNIMRESSYVLFEIPSIKKVVLICEDYGEATFVLDMDEGYQRGKIVSANKEELVQCFGATWIKFEESNIERWYKKLDKALFSDPGRKKEKIDIKEYRKNIFKMDKMYFEDAKRVKADVVEYARIAGLSSPLQLSTKFNGQIKCSNGEEVRFYTYLRRAGKVLIGHNDKNISLHLSEIRDELLKIAGYMVEGFLEMNKAYFEDAEKVKADLMEFAKATGDNDLIKLSIQFNREIKCSNGEEVRFKTYLYRARKVLFGHNDKNISLHLSEIRDELLKIAGYRVEGFLEMDKAYFEDAEKVKADLMEFAKATGHNDQIKLSIQFNGEIKCSNGEKVRFNTYLYRAGRALFGYSYKYVKSYLSEIRDELLKIAGYNIEMNKAYFENAQKVKADLMKFSNAAGYSQLVKLSVNFKGEIKCSNGEEVRFHTYLYRAGKALLGYDYKNVYSHLSEIRDELLKIAGY